MAAAGDTQAEVVQEEEVPAATHLGSVVVDHHTEADRTAAAGCRDPVTARVDLAVACHRDPGQEQGEGENHRCTAPGSSAAARELGSCCGVGVAAGSGAMMGS